MDFVVAAKARISTLIDERRAQGFDSFYLSQLGDALGSDLRKLKMHTGKRLAEFVRDEFNYMIVADEKHRTALFISFGNAPPGARPPRIRREIWEAFTSPLAPNCRRIFDTVRDRFLDLPASQSVPRDAIEVPRQLIIPNPGRHLVDAVSRNAREWAHSHDATLLDAT